MVALINLSFKDSSSIFFSKNGFVFCGFHLLFLQLDRFLGRETMITMLMTISTSPTDWSNVDIAYYFIKISVFLQLLTYILIKLISIYNNMSRVYGFYNSILIYSSIPQSILNIIRSLMMMVMMMIMLLLLLLLPLQLTFIGYGTSTSSSQSSNKKWTLSSSWINKFI